MAFCLTNNIISVPTLIGRQSHELIIHLQSGLWFVFWACNTTFNIPLFYHKSLVLFGESSCGYLYVTGKSTI